MDIGNPLHRAALAFAGLMVAFAVVLWVTPVGTAPANDRPAGYTGKPRAEAVKSADRAKPAAKPVSAPKPAPKPESKPKPLPEVANSAGEALDVSEACEEHLATLANRGLTVPEGWEIKCVGPGLDWQGNSHWGVACPYDSCPEGAGPYLSISNPTYYVIAHELCHANFGNDELMADNCAAEHGATLETSPYQ